MSKQQFWARLRLLILAPALFASLVTGLFQTQDAAAINHLDRLYFSQAPVPSGFVTTYGCEVMPGGVWGIGGANSDQIKASYIATIEDEYWNPDEARCHGSYSSGTKSTSLRKLGAAYVIQTMREYGPGAAYWLNGSDMDDWKKRINDPSITVRIEDYWFNRNTATYWRCSTPATRCFDVGQYTDLGPKGEGRVESSIVFYQNGKVVYVLKRSCGNPIGDLPGIPKPPEFNFDLTPAISVSPSSGEAGSSITVSPSVNNTGTTASTDANWSVSKFIVPPDGSVPGGAINGTPATSYYGNGASTVSSGRQAFPRNASPLSVPAQSIDDVPVGSQICYGLSVQPRRHDDSSYRHSTPACVVVAKKPKVQVIGGDLSVGRSIAGGSPITANVVTSTVTKGGKTYGSWTEYGVLASGTVTGMGSGASYSGGTTETNLCKIGVLTFTNTRNGSCKANGGGYAFSSLVGGFDTYLPRVGARTLPSNNVNLSSDIPQNDIGRDVYTTSAGSVSISGGGAVPKGKSVIINAPDTTITITGNITYTNAALSSVTEIPQVVIIARNIIISSDVDRIDAWLIATGTGANGVLNTCGAGEVDQGTSKINAKTCDSVLRINGPIMSNHLLLRRTAGAGTGSSSGDPAEVINLRADAYMWALARINLQSSRVSTVLTKELPPRF